MRRRCLPFAASSRGEARFRYRGRRSSRARNPPLSRSSLAAYSFPLHLARPCEAWLRHDGEVKKRRLTVLPLRRGAEAERLSARAEIDAAGHRRRRPGRLRERDRQLQGRAHGEIGPRLGLDEIAIEAQRSAGTTAFCTLAAIIAISVLFLRPPPHTTQMRGSSGMCSRAWPIAAAVKAASVAAPSSSDNALRPAPTRSRCGRAISAAACRNSCW